MGRDGEAAGQQKLRADPQESRVSGPAGLSKPQDGQCPHRSTVQGGSGLGLYFCGVNVRGAHSQGRTLADISQAGASALEEGE